MSLLDKILQKGRDYTQQQNTMQAAYGNNNNEQAKIAAQQEIDKQQLQAVMSGNNEKAKGVVAKAYEKKYGQGSSSFSPQKSPYIGGLPSSLPTSLPKLGQKNVDVPSGPPPIQTPNTAKADKKRGFMASIMDKFGGGELSEADQTLAASYSLPEVTPENVNREDAPQFEEPNRRSVGDRFKSTARNAVTVTNARAATLGDDLFEQDPAVLKFRTDQAAKTKANAEQAKIVAANKADEEGKAEAQRVIDQARLNEKSNENKQEVLNAKKNAAEIAKAAATKGSSKNESPLESVAQGLQYTLPSGQFAGHVMRDFGLTKEQLLSYNPNIKDLGSIEKGQVFNLGPDIQSLDQMILKEGNQAYNPNYQAPQPQIQDADPDYFTQSLTGSTGSGLAGTLNTQKEDLKNYRASNPGAVYFNPK